MTERDSIHALIKEMDALRIHFATLMLHSSKVKSFKEDVTIPLKSLAYRAEFMEIQQRQLFNQGWRHHGY